MASTLSQINPVYTTICDIKTKHRKTLRISWACRCTVNQQFTLPHFADIRESFVAPMRKRNNPVFPRFKPDGKMLDILNLLLV